MTHLDTPVGRALGWVEERTGAAGQVRDKLTYVFPRHLSFMWGEIALYSFLLLVLTGTFLALFYSASEARTVYDGSYEPLVGVEVSEAYNSVMQLSFDVRGGLLVRQVHHWAAIVFTGSILIHLCRVFFTGAFRKPREIQWLTGVALFGLASIEAFAGYSLLDDVLSGSGLRIGYSIVESIPLAGPHLAVWIWGGEFPGTAYFSRAFTAHVFLLPALIAGLIAVHLAMVVRQHHTEFDGPGRSEATVTGERAWPGYALKSAGLFLIVAAVLALMGGLVQINPVWLYGPYEPFVVSSGAQADWYVLWTQGALRLMPGWELRLGEVTLANQFFPTVLFPGLLAGGLAAYPWIERRVTGDDRPHHLLDRPRDRPGRTALGAGLLAGMVVLLFVGSDDVVAAVWDWDVVIVRWVGRVAVVVVPVVVALVTAKVCEDLRESSRRDAEPWPEE